MTPEDRAMWLLEQMQTIIEDDARFDLLVEAIREIEEEAAAAAMQAPPGMVTGASEATAAMNETAGREWMSALAPPPSEGMAGGAWEASAAVRATAERLYTCTACGKPCDPSREPIWRHATGMQHVACVEREEIEAAPLREEEDSIGGRGRLWLLAGAVRRLPHRYHDANHALEVADRVLMRPASEAHFDSYGCDLIEGIERCEQAIVRFYGASLADSLGRLSEEEPGR